MGVLFDGELNFHYGFLWFDTGVGADVELMSARGGQVTGILGAAEPGLLSMLIGMHTGLVPVRVEFHEVRPPQERGWPDVVEASLEARGPEVALGTFDDWRTLTLPRSGSYRARWHDDGADAGREDERYDADTPVVERCLLQLWLEPPGPVTVVRETSANAASWRTVAEQQARPPSVEARAYAERAAEQQVAADEYRATRARERQWHLQQWGGRDPSPRLLEVEQQAVPLSRDRRDLVDALAALRPEQQRALARELVHRACAETDATAAAGTDWAPALSAIDRGDPLPPPFDDGRTAYAAVLGWGEASVSSTVGIATFGGARPPRQPLHPASAAVGAVLGAALTDPLAAVLATVEAVSGSAPDLDEYFAGVRARVRDLSAPGS